MGSVGFRSGVFFTQVRVYYEDTDAAGIVYYANYLKFAERARTDALRACGIDQSLLLREHGLGFVVRRVQVDHHAPAQLDALLDVETHLHNIGRVRMSMVQRIVWDGQLLCTLQVEIAMIDQARKPARIPQEIITALRTKMVENSQDTSA